MQKDGRGRRHPRQDHHDLDDRRAARHRRARPDGDQRRHHQPLRLQRPARQRRLVGDRGRRERRQLPEARRHHRRRHQHRSRAPRTLRQLRRGQGRVRRVHRERAVLRARRAVRRRSRRPVGPVANPRPARGHLRFLGAGRHARRQCRPGARRKPLRRIDPGTRRGAPDDRQHPRPDPRAPQCPERARGHRRRARARNPRGGHHRRLREVRRGQAPLQQGRRGRRRDRSSTITAIIRSKSGRCCRRRAKAPRGG